MFMKQVKFFLVALMAVVMGMSVTSCMNGDDNHNVTMTVPVKYNYSSFLMGDGTTKFGSNYRIRFIGWDYVYNFMPI